MSEYEITTEEREQPRLDECPYCGGPGEIVSLLKRKHDLIDPDEWELETSYGRKFQARCGGDKCPVQPETVLCDSPDEAAEMWNTRAEAKPAASTNFSGGGSTS